MFLEFFGNFQRFMYMYVLDDFYLIDLKFSLISFEISKVPLSLNWSVLVWFCLVVPGYQICEMGT